jgi:ribonucleoside-triphosphate reductase
MRKIIKRNGDITVFDSDKIAAAMMKAFVETGDFPGMDHAEIHRITSGYASAVESILDSGGYGDTVSIETVQDAVEEFLMKLHPKTAKVYVLYREERSVLRNEQRRFMSTMEEVMSTEIADSDIKRENANVDGSSPMGTMLQAGETATRAFFRAKVLPEKILNAFGRYIHIHDFSFYGITLTCCQIDLERLFKGGFHTGHGALREPNSISSYTSLAAITLQANQNDMHGGQSIPNFDRFMAGGVKKTFRKQFEARLFDAISDIWEDTDESLLKTLVTEAEEICPLPFDADGDNDFAKILFKIILKRRLNVDDVSVFTFGKYGVIGSAISKSLTRAYKETEKMTHQAMEGFVHNLNTMASRAGAQVPFSSINYGTDTSPEGRMVTKQLLLATIEGLGDGETPIFPVQIFRRKKGINTEPGDPNYDLFRLALECSAKRMFPNFSFQDASFNLKYYKEGDPRTEIAYMGCRTRVIGNVYDPKREISYSRGNLSWTTINLVRLAIEAQGDKDAFLRSLDAYMELTAEQLLHRFEMQARKKAKNFKFLMQNGVWLDSEKLGPEDEIREVIKHGTLTTGFIGLAECLKTLTGKHHGESAEAQELGLSIVKRMRDICDKKSAETGLNFTLLATPAEGLSGKFTNADRADFGVIEGVTDREFYTNGFHVPVYHNIGVYDKIKIEAPYHELTNGGHVSYVELDGDITNNPDALESIIKCMEKSNMGYGAVNHPIDRCAICGFSGVIGDECPVCGAKDKCAECGFEGSPDKSCPNCGSKNIIRAIERIRRITGYLVGTLDRFNDAKRAEEKARTKHM